MRLSSRPWVICSVVFGLMIKRETVDASSIGDCEDWPGWGMVEEGERQTPVSHRDLQRASQIEAMANAHLRLQLEWTRTFPFYDVYSAESNEWCGVRVYKGVPGRKVKCTSGRSEEQLQGA